MAHSETIASPSTVHPLCQGLWLFVEFVPLNKLHMFGWSFLDLHINSRGFDFLKEATNGS